jgi:hypothetical protein
LETSICGLKYEILESPNFYKRYSNTIDNDIHSLDLDLLPVRSSLDKTVNTSGIKLLDTLMCSDLKIDSGRTGQYYGISHFTYMLSTGNSCVDYGISSYRLLPIISNLLFTIEGNKVLLERFKKCQIKRLFNHLRIFKIAKMFILMMMLNSVLTVTMLKQVDMLDKEMTIEEITRFRFSTFFLP